uniref:Uncharacterized protein n=1 Tax=Pectinophora gossypiella TaxID=13191 RepID=A0A1E1W5J5_PECGO
MNKDVKSGNSEFLMDLKNALKKRPATTPKPPKEIIRTSSDVKLAYQDKLDSKIDSKVCAKEDVNDVVKEDGFVKEDDNSRENDSAKGDVEEVYAKENDVEECDGTAHTDIYENMTVSNVSDDVKAKLSNIYGDKAQYVAMDNHKRHQRRRSTSDAVPHFPLTSLGIYATMDGNTRQKIKSKFNLKKHSYEPCTENFHIKGDDGCIYCPIDVSYIYDCNPNTVDGDSLFVRSKDKIYAPPCFCPRNGDNSIPIEKDIFFSCEDIYVNFNNVAINNTDEEINVNTDFKEIKSSINLDESDDEEYVIEKFDKTPTASTNSVPNSTGSNDVPKSSGVFKKKITQIKQLFVDW